MTSLTSIRLMRAICLMFVSTEAVMSMAEAALASRCDLFHVDARTWVEHRPALRERDHRQRVGFSPRNQARAVDRVDSHIDGRCITRSDRLAVIEHGCLVFFSFADHHHAVHVHHVEKQPHRVDGRLIGGVLVAPSDPACGRESRGLGATHQVKRQVIVGHRVDLDAVAASPLIAPFPKAAPATVFFPPGSIDIIHSRSKNLAGQSFITRVSSAEARRRKSMMSVHLTEDLEYFIRDAVRTGRYAEPPKTSSRRPRPAPKCHR